MDARPNLKRRCQVWLVLGFLSLVFARDSAAQAEFESLADSAQDAHASAAARSFGVLDANGRVAGYLLGLRVTRNSSGQRVPGLEVASADGLLAVYQASGRLGQIAELGYSDEECAGEALVLLSSLQQVDQVFFPGFVFAHGENEAVFSVPRLAAPQERLVRSISRTSAEGDGCLPVNAAEMTLKAVRGQANEAAIAHRPGPLSVRALSTGRQPLAGFLAAQPRNGDQSSFEGGRALPLAKECAPGCDPAQLGDGVCQVECNSSLCAHDQGDCTRAQIEEALAEERKQCNVGCGPDDLGDGFCDERCNVASCQYDLGDCPR